MTEQLIMDIKFDPRNTPRPPIGHPVFVRKGIESILPAIKAWAGPGCGDDESLISDLTEALNNVSEEDGYELAKYLEKEGWETDRNLLDILDDLYGYIDDAHLEAVVTWCKTADLVYPDVGAMVKVGNITGVVTGRNTAYGTCVVDRVGNKSPGLYVFNVEDIEVLDELREGSSTMQSV